MDIRNVLNGYFEKTPVPKELDPHNASRFVVPNVTEKREAEIEPLTEEQPQEQQKIQTPEPIRNKGQIAEPTQQKRQSAEQTQQVQFSPVAKAPAPEYSPQTADYEVREENEQVEINASAFIKIVRHHRLTGMEFLSILGNSKISNKAYQEIKSNPGLTVKRLIELLEESPLTPSDYERLIIAVQRMSELKAEAKAKIKSEPARTSVRSEASAEHTAAAAPKQKPPEINAETVKITKDAPTHTDVFSPNEKKSSGYTPSAAKYYYDPDEGEDEDKNDGGGNDSEYKENNVSDEARMEQLNAVKSKIQINFDDDNFDDDEDDDYDDYDGEGGRKRGSNNGKIAVSAIGAVILIGLSFGLRYSATGSWLPSEGVISEEKVLDEGAIFDNLNALPAASPVFTSNTAYSAGGIREESVFKSSVCGNRRLLYSENNKLYIYEQIGGQIAKLETRDYKDRTFIGIIDAGDKLAAVSTGTAEPYSYTYTVPAASEDEEPVSAVGIVQRKETYVEITDASSPEKTAEENKLILSGTVAAAYIQDNRLILVTYDVIEAESAREDKAAFMPYISVNGSKIFCEAEKIFIPENPTHNGIAAVFSVDLSNAENCDIAASAGGRAPLVSKSENELFIGQNSTLIRYSLDGGVFENGHCEISGYISGFSGINSLDGEIRVTTLEQNPETEEYSASLTVLDGELNLIGEIKNIGKGEALSATCFYKRETYIVTENGTCFGIDGDNGVMSQSSVKITNENVYKYSDEIGVKITASDNGAVRTGLTVSTVKLDGNLTPLYSLEINSKTAAANALDEYLSSPAEEDVGTLGGSGENGFLVIPIKYFDGVCQVERFVICSVGTDGILSVNGSVTEYDRRSERLFAQVDGDVVIAVTKGKIITAKAQDGSVQGYFLT